MQDTHRHGKPTAAYIVSRKNRRGYTNCLSFVMMSCLCQVFILIIARTMPLLSRLNALISVRVYASVRRILTAIPSDAKALVFRGLCSVSCRNGTAGGGGGGRPLLLGRDFCSIYMFTLTISICCFWNNQQRGPEGRSAGNCRKSRSTWVS